MELTKKLLPLALSYKFREEMGADGRSRGYCKTEILSVDNINNDLFFYLTEIYSQSLIKGVENSISQARLLSHEQVFSWVDLRQSLDDYFCVLSFDYFEYISFLTGKQVLNTLIEKSM